ncbi:MAG: response regulator, partial [Alphaproteobacteria bacterium]|nr:response regulator [Alphaproteobacteria bacterium]
MQTEPLQSARQAESPVEGGFSHVRPGIAFEDMTLIRNELVEFLQLRGVKGECIGNAQLVVTEILSNIVKHPEKKARHVEIRADVTDTEITLVVRDDSSAFANFDAKCKNARDVLHTGITGAETGYGLGCILVLSSAIHYVPAAAEQDGLNRFTAVLAMALREKPEKRKKIFLIDDDPVSLHIHRAMLEDIYAVISFENAEEALDAFAREQPDAVVSDLVMPRMDGAELRKALDGVKSGNTTPFIFLSGRDTNESNPYISTLGVDDFL